MEAFGKKYGPWALVAGGSEGLGAAFAEDIAALGLNLILVARRPGPLDQTAQRLRGSHGVEVRTVAVDTWVKNRAGRGYAAGQVGGRRPPRVQRGFLP